MDSSLIGTYSASIQVSASDTAQALPSAATQFSVINNSTGSAVVEYHYYPAVLITVEGYDIRIRYSADPTQGDSPEGHLIVKNTSLRVVGQDNINNIRFIAATSGQVGVLQVSPET